MSIIWQRLVENSLEKTYQIRRGEFPLEKDKNGSEKMQIKEGENENETTMKGEMMNGVSSRIPTISKERLEVASQHENLHWAHGWMAGHRDGLYHAFNEDGLTLQRVSEKAVRCIAVVDHSYCYATLGFLTAIFEAAGIEMQIDPYAVTVPYEPREEDETPTPIGVEVA